MHKLVNRPLRIVAALAYGWFAVAALAYGGEPPTLNAQQLGVAESALKYCGPIDPESAKKLQAKVAELVKGASAAELAKVRKSVEYQKARDLMDSFVSEIDEHNAKTVCTNSATDK